EPGNDERRKEEQDGDGGDDVRQPARLAPSRRDLGPVTVGRIRDWDVSHDTRNLPEEPGRRARAPNNACRRDGRRPMDASTSATRLPDSRPVALRPRLATGVLFRVAASRA